MGCTRAAANKQQQQQQRTTLPILDTTLVNVIAIVCILLNSHSTALDMCVGVVVVAVAVVELRARYEILSKNCRSTSLPFVRFSSRMRSFSRCAASLRWPIGM